ncbi:hypothetical protein QZH41_014302, partial [Actinostola sp. cb2023]
YVDGSFLPKEGAHFCRENGRQLTFTTVQDIGTLVIPGYGYNALLRDTNDLELCFGLCCKLAWCKRAILGHGKCYGSSCRGDHCGVTNPWLSRFNGIEHQKQSMLHKDVNDPFNPWQNAADSPCLKTAIIFNVTLSSGINSGKFTDHGTVSDMASCQQKCCDMSRCDVTFMVGKRCLSVTCHKEENCLWVPVSNTKHQLQLSYVTSPHKIKEQAKRGSPTIPFEATK